MSTTREWVNGMIDMWGKDRAISELIQKINTDRQQDNDLHNSRFFEKMPLLDDNQDITGYKLVKRTEQQVSSSYDLDDCHDHGEFFYDDDGVLYPVTVGTMSRQDMAEHEIVYGSASMIANGKVVGTVVYTDH